MTASVPLWSNTSLQAIVPASATSGPVVVTVDGHASNGQAFAIVDEVVTYYHTDAIGSVRMTTDASGATIARYDYLAFGQPWPGAAGQDPEPRRFAGMERDLETGGVASWETLNYAGARYYSGADRAVHQSASIRGTSGSTRERRRLVLCVREAPLSEIHLDNMVRLARMGAVILPPVPTFYNHPATIDDLVDHTVARLLDQFGLAPDESPRWTGDMRAPAHR